jgi:hypothetical protein
MTSCPSPVRRKPCPYCGKKLQAASKTKWRNNLARHLANCAPHQREWISMYERFVLEMLSKVIPPQQVERPMIDRSPNAKAEVEALERLANL